MRAFIVLCLIAFAAADSLPYNYGPVSHSDVGFGRGEAVSSGDQGAASSDAGHIISGGGAGGFGGSSVGAGGFGGSSGVAGGFVGSASGDGGLQKEFYSFTANDAEFEQADASQQIESSVKRNLQVIFIKGPESHGLEQAALNLARHASEQRTAIYVLQKQADLGTLARRLNVEQSHDRQRPEVHFVKYRTPEDAQHAQHTIQSQYDQLGGSSSNYNGGVAPVINFASQGSRYGGSAGGVGGFGGSSGGAGGFGAGSAPVVNFASQGSSYSGSAGGVGSVGGSSGGAGGFGAGSAPVVNFASQGSSYSGSAGGAGGFGGSSGGAGGFGAGSAPSANYLPASILRLRRH